MRWTARTVRRVSQKVCALRFGALNLWAIGLGLAAMPAPFLFPNPAQAQAAQASDTLPTNLNDYRCFVLIQDRQQAYMSNAEIDEIELVQVVNNLIIIAAFYAGRMTHYSTVGAEENFATVRAELADMSPEARTETGNNCATFYLSVIELLGQLDSSGQ